MPDGRFALVVASSRYADPTLTQLEAPAHDARSLAAVLATPEIGDFEVTTLTDEPAPKVMQEIEAFFDGRRREDLVLFYFSGHGILDEGEVKMLTNEILEQEDIDEGYILGCQSMPLTDVVKIRYS